MGNLTLNHMRDFNWSDYKVTGYKCADTHHTIWCSRCGWQLVTGAYVAENSIGDIKYLGADCVSKVGINKVFIPCQEKSFSKKAINALKKAKVKVEEEIPF